MYTLTAHGTGHGDSQNYYLEFDKASVCVDKMASAIDFFAKQNFNGYLENYEITMRNDKDHVIFKCNESNNPMA